MVKEQSGVPSHTISVPIVHLFSLYPYLQSLYYDKEQQSLHLPPNPNLGTTEKSTSPGPLSILLPPCFRAHM